ncbi:S-layer homology domain-containing protein [Leucobacter allii]|uniref:S-layer homology domain-containing protein n=1 Tax=Leucobacter allii TaxID=2932247 RepID=UPI001FD12F59|nr:S-layer homology domain-containing protein [Leucobacter allii]UOR03237.1 S-layer homology domain-containing protein [Leucobacter allii]
MKLRRPIAALTATALAMTGAAFGAAAAAQASPGLETAYVPGDEIRPSTAETESSVYNEWHFGPGTGRAQSVALQARNGVELEAGVDTQIIRGNGNDLDPAADGTSVEELIAGLGVAASDTSRLSYQVGIRIDTDGDGVWEPGEGWSTLRAPVANPAGNWTTSQPIGALAKNASLPLADLLAELATVAEAEGPVYPISFGFLASKPAAGTLVSSFTAEGVTTRFSAAPAVAAELPASLDFVGAAQIRPNEDSYAGWHDGAAAGGSYASVIGARGAIDGLEVTGKAQILNGFADEDFLPNALARAAGARIVATGEAWAQFPVFWYQDGVPGAQFTTIRAQVPASGVLAEAEAWISSKGLPGIPANTGASLEAILAAIGDHDLIGYGVFVDAGRTATITSIAFDGAQTDFARAASPAPESGRALLSEIANPSTGAEETAVYNDWHFDPDHGNADGSVTQARNGLAIAAGGDALVLRGNGNDQAIGAATTPIAELAASLGVVASSTEKLSYQIPVRVDTDGDAAWQAGEGWTTLRAPAADPEGDWTTSQAIPGSSFGANARAPLAELVDALGPNAYPIGAGFLVAKSAEDVLVSSFTADGATTRFFAEPAAPAPAGDPLAEQLALDGIRPDESSYPGWHNGVAPDDARLGGIAEAMGEHGAVLGLEISGKYQLLNGFAPEDVLVNAASRAAELVVDADGPVWAQIPVHYYPEGSLAPQFTTLRALVPESGNLAEASSWITSRALPGIAANAEASLDEIVAALGDHDVIGYGVFVDAEQTATIRTIAFDGTTTDLTRAGIPPFENPFEDIAEDTKFGTEILWMAEQGLTTGFRQADGTTRFDGARKVTREAVAAFLYRIAAPEGYTAPATSPFADVDPGDQFYTEISWMHEAGLSTGTKQADGTRTFAPKSTMSREAFAAFMYRMEAPTGYTAPKASPFADVRTSHRFYKQIAWMHESGLSTGTRQGAGKKPIYQPLSKLTRQATAAFLFRSDQLFSD